MRFPWRLIFIFVVSAAAGFEAYWLFNTMKLGILATSLVAAILTLNDFHHIGRGLQLSVKMVAMIMGVVVVSSWLSLVAYTWAGANPIALPAALSMVLTAYGLAKLD